MTTAAAQIYLISAISLTLAIAGFTAHYFYL